MTPPDPARRPGPLLEPADLAIDAQGHPCSPRYGDVYASRAGALGQARDVFLRGCGLLDPEPAWRGREHFTVLETGFGLGINFLATWAAWRADPQRCRTLHYVALELHPVPAAELVAHAPAEVRELAVDLAVQWPPPLRGLHTIVLGGGDHAPHASASRPLPPEGALPALGRPGGGEVRLLLAFGDAGELAPRLRLAADALFLDGFAPARNPQMWQPGLLRALAALARPGARAATYSVARVVRDGLAQVGFEVAIAPGWGGKRQRLEAIFAPRWPRPRYPLPEPWPSDRPRGAIVIGAGIAGAACARALAARGWQVDVLEAGPHPASVGSAMPAGLAHVQLSADDNVLSRLTRAGMAALRRAAPGGRADLVRFGGVLMTAENAAEAARLEAWRETLRLPPRTAQWLDAAAAAQALGTPGAGAGWLVEGAAVANMPLCLHWLQADTRIRLQCNVRAARIARDGDDWCIHDADGVLLARAPQVVLAGAADVPALLAASGLLPAADWMPLRQLRGQAQTLPANRWPALAGLRGGWMGLGYALPVPEAAAAQLRAAADAAEADWLLVGATYESPDVPLAPEAAWRDNCAGVAVLADGTAPAAVPQSAAAPWLRSHVGVRAVSPDRLPYCGAVPDLRDALAEPARWAGKRLHELPRHPGLAVCAGMGSRGLTLAALLAECVATEIEGEPLPVETDLAACLDPARVALKRLRRG